MDGHLWASGLNNEGQLGVQSMQGYRLIYDQFTKVSALDDIFEK
jgi:hypothetical protein